MFVVGNATNLVYEPFPPGFESWVRMPMVQMAQTNRLVGCVPISQRFGPPGSGAKLTVVGSSQPRVTFTVTFERADQRAQYISLYEII